MHLGGKPIYRRPSELARRFLALLTLSGIPGTPRIATLIAVSAQVG